MGSSGKVKLATFDLSPRASCRRCATARWSSPSTSSSILQGYLPIVLLRLYNKYGLMPGADVLTGPGFVTKDNAAR